MIGRKRSKRANRVDTLVGGDTVIHGDIEFSGGLHIEGRVIGDIRAPADQSAVLVIAEGGTVDGQIAVSHLLMNGKVEGDVHVNEHAELGGTACLAGNLFYNRLQMSEGARVDGQLRREDAPLQGELEGPATSPALAGNTTADEYS